MRKIYKIAGVMLVTGVLMAGIGSGVAFAEYSTFEYGGESTLEGSEYFTKTLEYKIPPKESCEMLNIVINGGPYAIVEDSSISKDMVQFEISYLADDRNVKPRLEEYTGEDVKYIYLSCDYRYNTFRDIMRVKDPVLSDLKNHKISNYQLDRIEVIEIHVNPEADFGIEVNYY